MPVVPPEAITTDALLLPVVIPDTYMFPDVTIGTINLLSVLLRLTAAPVPDVSNVELVCKPGSIFAPAMVPAALVPPLYTRFAAIDPLSVNENAPVELELAVPFVPLWLANK
jgi:hypothetical protein